MKKPFLFLLILSAFAAGKIASVEKTATVSKTDGYYIFWECDPTDNYETLGVIGYGNGLSINDTYTVRKNGLLKSLRKKYPEADGLLYQPDKHGHTKAFAIKFK